MVNQSRILKQTKRQVSFEEAVARLPVIVDVRSAREHFEGALPGSVNVPLFDDDERALVGTIYRHGGQKQAIDTGMDLVEAKLAEFIQLFEQFRGQEIGIFCARGGMRSRSVVNLLNDAGFSAWQLRGGYKDYRRIVLERLQSFTPELIVVHGLTGTGKTRLLQQLDPFIDLEDLARHRSSLFGALNLEPRTQKDFDAYLYHLIPTLGGPPCFIEGESRKLGDVFLPSALAESMKAGRQVLVTASIETRIDRIVEDYPVPDEETAEKIVTILEKLTFRMGKEWVAKMSEIVRQGELRELVRILFEDYYDKRYANSMKRYRFELEVNSDDLDEAADVLMKYRESVISTR